MSREEERASVTEALRVYDAEATALLGFTSFMGSVVTRADEVALLAARTLLKISDEDPEREKWAKTVERGGAGVEEAMQTRYAQLATRMVFQRLVDTFISYIAELLRLIFTTRPEALRSSETVRLEEVLRYETMDELVRFLVERRVERLTYLSVADLAEDLHSLLGLRLFEDKEELRKVVELVGIRNLLAHNRGIVNARFLRLVRDYAKSEGEEVWLTADDFFDAVHLLGRVTRRLDREAIDHFALDAAPPGTEAPRT